jgi:hypothetical protein
MQVALDLAAEDRSSKPAQRGSFADQPPSWLSVRTLLALFFLAGR